MKLLLICLLMCSVGFAKSPTGTLAGIVTDSEGNALHWTRVELLEARRDTIIEELFGCFIFPFVEQGEYSLALHRMGYADDTLRKVIVVSDSVSFIEITMKDQPIQMEAELIAVQRGSIALSGNV